MNVLRIGPVLIGLCLPTLARAAAPADLPDPFAAGKWTVQLTGSYIDTDVVANDTVNGAQGAFGFNYYVVDKVSLGADLAIYGIHPVETGAVTPSAAGSISWRAGISCAQIVSRVTWMAASASWRLITSSGPAETTSTSTNAPGWALPAQFNTDLLHMGGARYLHVSDDDINGANRNLGADAVEFYLGLLFSL